MTDTEPLINAVINEVNAANNVCTLCSRTMENNQPTTELMCRHKFHTACFLTELWMQYQNQCHVCNTPFFTHETVQESREKETQKREARAEKLLEKFQENKQAGLDLKLVKRQIAKVRKTRTALRRFQTAQKNEHHAEAGQLEKILADMAEKRKKKIMDSDEYAAWKTEKIRLQRYIHVFDAKYTTFSLNELAEIPKLKLPSRWELRRLTRFYVNRLYRLLGRYRRN